MKVFWSWQSDTPRSAGKDFVRECLDRVCEEISTDADLELPQRPEVDQDTQGVAGTPEVVRTILEKIEGASVFIADVTLVAATSGGKRVPNPNVMFELGYALHVLDAQQIVLVMNLTHGGPSFLPFDLGMHRWPLTYRLDQNVNDDRKVEISSDLKDVLQNAIGDSLRYAINNRREIVNRNAQAFNQEQSDFEERWLNFIRAHAARHQVLGWTPETEILNGYGLRCTAAFSRPFTIDDITNRRELRVPLLPVVVSRSIGQMGQPTDCVPNAYRPGVRAWIAEDARAGIQNCAMRHAIDSSGTISCEYFTAFRPESQNSLLPIGWIMWLATTTMMMSDFLRRRLDAPDALFDIQLQIVRTGHPIVCYFFGVPQQNSFHMQPRSILLPMQRVGTRNNFPAILRSIQRDIWNSLGAALRDEEIIDFDLDLMWQSQDRTTIT